MPRAAQVKASRRSRILRCAAIIALAAIIAVGIAVLIIWLVIKPREIVYTVEDGSIDGFDLRKNTLNATFSFTFRAYNPNRRVAIQFDPIVVDVWYDEQMIASNDIPPFVQPHHNVTRLMVKAEARSMSLFGFVSSDLRRQRRQGRVELEVWLRARIRFKVGTWKSRSYSMRAICAPVVLHFNPSTGFDRTYCDVDL